jgi:hypothetical protein
LLETCMQSSLLLPKPSASGWEIKGTFIPTLKRRSGLGNYKNRHILDVSFGM